MNVTGKRPRILLADDHVLLLEAFQSLLGSECEIVGTARDGLELLQRARALVPDIAIIDVSMPHMNGLAAVRELRDELPSIKVIFLTVHEDADLAASALRAGAAGFVLKSAAARDLFDAIRAVLAGGSYVTPAIAAAVQESLRDPNRRFGLDRISARQSEILQLLVEGKTMKEIAHALGITPRTVAFHKYRLMEFLGVASTAELIQLATRHGMKS